jgi:putative transcriptional regulator
MDGGHYRSSRVENLRGQLLISGGGLYDPHFRHTVVLVGEHGPDGTVGVVLNRPLELTVGEAVPPLAALTGADAPVSEGGPVESRQVVLLVEAADPRVLDLPVFGSVGFLTGDVSAAMRPAVRRARVFLGHSGWAPGQLEAELEAGAWILDPAGAEDVFGREPQTLWQRVLVRKGPPFAALARVPFDPSAN